MFNVKITRFKRMSSNTMLLLLYYVESKVFRNMHYIIFLVPSPLFHIQF